MEHWETLRIALRGWKRPIPGHLRDRLFTSISILERNDSWRNITISLIDPPGAGPYLV
jgi:hypothetical protein